jgi:hypothetical protein
MRANLTKRSVAAAIGCAFITLLAISYYSIHYGSRLTIINNSNDPITNVVVEAGGSRITFDRIAPRGKRCSSFHIAKESDVVISYIDKNGYRCEFGDVYLTQSIDALITIEVQREGSNRISVDSLEDWWESLPQGRLNRSVVSGSHFVVSSADSQSGSRPNGSP